MFKKIVLNLFILAGVSMYAQSNGINFQKIDLETAKKTAAKENKLIFIDLYTTWCGPCKLMAKKTFTDPQIGEMFNKNFVSLAIDAEKEGVKLAKEFKVVNYPSFLFLDPKGELVQYDFGYYNPAQFLEVGASVLRKKTDQSDKTLDQVKGKMIGDKIDNFTAKDHLGNTFSSSKENQKLIIVFIRGQWCPYCNKYIETLQNLAPELKSKNARLVIISPEKPEFIEKTISKTKTDYTVLYDEGYKIAEAFDVLYTPNSETLGFYTSRLKDDFTKSRSDNSGRLPVSATFILNENKEITWRHFDPDYKNRASIEDILKNLH
ncbi:redoxin domain-containing protein [Chryseobacterium sp. Tr-659]|uniref:redoxin domain-containing protein n=1 Tax=Chryseobacterium sp. Tr-659 TaxID=2608340 RepID=UPI001420B1A7|nr:redoxin domain-containing protein [Chryseobacterium sp. Tr-659]NIF03818.1 redoxin domain-containing protein [Chryseobacterium sp. Tr-659]